MPSDLTLKTLPPKTLPSQAVSTQQLLDFLGDKPESKKSRSGSWVALTSSNSDGLARKIWRKGVDASELPSAVIFSRLNESQSLIHVSFKIPARADDVEALLQKVGIEEVVTCGHRKADVLQIFRGGVFFHEKGKAKSKLLALPASHEFIWIKDIDRPMAEALAKAASKKSSKPKAASSSPEPEEESPAASSTSEDEESD